MITDYQFGYYEYSKAKRKLAQSRRNLYWLGLMSLGQEHYEKAVQAFTGAFTTGTVCSF